MHVYINYKRIICRIYLMFLDVTLRSLQPKRYERRKSFRNSRETIGITSNMVDTPVTASRKQLIQQVIHLEIRRNIAREEFEESEGAGGCYQLWINQAKFPGSVLMKLPRENVQVYSSRMHRLRNTASIDITIKLIKRLNVLFIRVSLKVIMSSEIIDFYTT